MKKLFGFLFLPFFILSCSGAVDSQNTDMAQNQEVVELQIDENESSSGVEAELTQDLNNLLNEVSNEQ